VEDDEERLRQIRRRQEYDCALDRNGECSVFLAEATEEGQAREATEKQGGCVDEMRNEIEGLRQLDLLLGEEYSKRQAKLTRESIARASSRPNILMKNMRELHLAPTMTKASDVMKCNATIAR